MKIRPLAITLVLLCLASGAAPAAAQQILLDARVDAGGLTLYRDLRRENVYYYLPNRPRLAVDASGKPLFSFSRWVENVRSAPGEDAVRQGEGGGLIHCMVELGVSEEELEVARRELRRIKPGATIEGAIGFRGGKMALVFIDPEEGGLVEQVMGIGPAAILGGRTAVNVILSKDGAQILWQLFQRQSSPPLAFQFVDMEVAGFREKIGVRVHADLRKIYNHKTFAAGVAGTYFGAEIEAAFDELRDQGAIREEWIGEDEGFERLVGQVYRPLLQQLFEPSADLQQLSRTAGSTAGGGGLLDKANDWLNAGRASARDKSKTVDARADKLEKEAADLDAKAAALEKEADAHDAEIVRLRSSPSRERPAAKASSAEIADLRKRYEASRREVEVLRKQAKDAKTPAERTKAVEAGKKKQAEAKRLKAELDTAGASSGTARAPTTTAAAEARIEQLQGQSAGKRQQAEDARKRATEARARKPGSVTGSGKEDSGPAVAVLASFRMKKQSTEKELVIELNRHRSDVVPTRFDAPLGRVGQCKSCFVEINQDDPLYRQREIFVYLDGLDAEHFERTINFVGVQLRKRHASGSITDDEVRIDRRSLEASGNRFKLLYGWNGDNDRERWLDYEYRVVWSFYGGHTIEEPWRSSTDPALNVAPPLVARSIQLASDSEALAAAEVRLITVQLHYELAGSERTETVSLSPEAGELAARVDLLWPRGASDYDYEIEWTLRGNRSLATGRRTTRAGTLFLDELPGG